MQNYLGPSDTVSDISYSRNIHNYAVKLLQKQTTIGSSNQFKSLARPNYDQFKKTGIEMGKLLDMPLTQT